MTSMREHLRIEVRCEAVQGKGGGETWSETRGQMEQNMKCPKGDSTGMSETGSETS